MLLSTGAILCQTNDTTYIYGDSLKTNNIQIFKGWDYHPGDDSTWGLPAFFRWLENRELHIRS